MKHALEKVHELERVSLVALKGGDNVAGRAPAEVSAALAEDQIFVWDGNYYALELMEGLGLEGQGGAVRVGAVHYNTVEEIDAFVDAVARCASQS